MQVSTNSDNVITADRVRKASRPGVNRKIDVDTAYSISHYKRQDTDVIAKRIEALEREWDVERVLEVNVGVLALGGLLLGLKVDRRWFIVPGIVLPFLIQHGIQGWCPPLPLLRALGVRTRSEIDREKYALKPFLNRV